MTIPVMKPWFGPEEAAAAAEAVESGWVAQGPRVQAFEEAVARHVGLAHAVALSSCTAALHLALHLLDLGHGDEVIVPSLSFIATTNVVAQVGAVPVFADVDVSTLNMTPELVRRAITPRTRAVILVHQAGTPADSAAVRSVCEPRGITVIDDAACALGSSYEDLPVGAGGELVALSFHPRKVITTGEGGMLLTCRDDLAERARQLREHGMTISASARHQSDQVILEQYLEAGFNYRMTDVQAAIGLVQLARLGEIVAQRRRLAANYRDALAEVPGLIMARDPARGRSNFQSFWALLPDWFPISRDELMRNMLAAGISTRRGIMAAHLEPAYADVPRDDLPVTERVAHGSVILPMFHTMSVDQQRHVVDIFRKGAGLSASL